MENNFNFSNQQEQDNVPKSPAKNDVNNSTLNIAGSINMMTSSTSPYGSQRVSKKSTNRRTRHLIVETKHLEFVMHVIFCPLFELIIFNFCFKWKHTFCAKQTLFFFAKKKLTLIIFFFSVYYLFSFNSKRLPNDND